MILAILQARTSSTRLPGKVLLPVAGAPMLARQLERVGRARSIHKLVVATSDQPADEPVAALATATGVEACRGSLDDVLDRFYHAAAPHSPTHVVRLTGDCPLADPDVIDGVVRLHLESGADYTSNVFPPTWPDGLDVEVTTFAALERAWREATTVVQREHVTPYINRNPDLFRMENLRASTDLSGHRWTVDDPRDLEFVRAVYDALYPANPAFTTRDILALLARRPELIALNEGTERNEGLKRAEQALAAAETNHA